MQGRDIHNALVVHVDVATIACVALSLLPLPLLPLLLLLSLLKLGLLEALPEILGPPILLPTWEICRLHGTVFVCAGVRIHRSEQLPSGQVISTIWRLSMIVFTCAGCLVMRRSSTGLNRVSCGTWICMEADLPF